MYCKKIYISMGITMLLIKQLVEYPLFSCHKGSVFVKKKIGSRLAWNNFFQDVLNDKL